MAIYVPNTEIVGISSGQVPADMREHANSVCAIVNQAQIDRNGKPKTALFGLGFTAGAYGDKYFGEQLCGPYLKTIPTVWGEGSGTGFAVGKMLIATAYHVVEDHAPKTLRAVFGLDLDARGSNRRQCQVFDIDRVHAFDRQRDWALLVLRKPLGKERPALPLASAVELERLALNAPLAMIGHPFGQPMQYATGQFIGQRDTSDLAAKIAGFTGNSGSPVFALGRLGKVIGIYKSHDHEEDFEEKREPPHHRCWDYKRVQMGVAQRDLLAAISPLVEYI